MIYLNWFSKMWANSTISPMMNRGRAWLPLGHTECYVSKGIDWLMSGSSLSLKICMLPIDQYPKNNMKIGATPISSKAVLLILSS